MRLMVLLGSGGTKGGMEPKDRGSGTEPKDQPRTTACSTVRFQGRQKE